MKEPVYNAPVERIQSWLGDKVVVVWVPSGQKFPQFRNWQKISLELMQNPGYLRNLNDKGHNLAVLTGAPSGGVCSIDVDDDANAAVFLDLNPALRNTLRTRGARGCNFWLRMQGEFPPFAELKTRDGKHWGEWRADGHCTMIYGKHPSGVMYQAIQDFPAIEVPFSEITWPEDLVLPWMPSAEEESDPVDAELRKRFGEPVFFAKAHDGSLYVKGINQPYWAGLYSAENIALHEPNEGEFYRYSAETGLYTPESTDAIKQAISSRMLEMSRQDEVLQPLEFMRADSTLKAVTSQLRGIIEKRDAFANRQRIVHLANGVLKFDDKEIDLLSFSPSFYSRNRSPIPFDAKARCPRFLGELIEPAVHPEDVILLQKMAGQCLLGDNLTQRLLILDGEAERGKTQYVNALQGLVGMENVTQLRTAHLHERFELFRFLRRTLLVGVDVDADFLASKGAPVIKGLVGGDWFDAEQKGGTGSFQIQGRFNVMMVSNCRLKVRLQGDVGAWRRRLLIVRYEAPKPKKKIPNFGALLVREEGSGILNWALDGLQLLLDDIDKTGDIRTSTRQAGIVDSLLAESDSLRHFLRERVGGSPGSDLTSDEIVRAYANYCPEMGWEALTETVIARQLPSLMLELFRTTKAHDIQRDGRNRRGFRDVAFKEQEDTTNGA